MKRTLIILLVAVGLIGMTSPEPELEKVAESSTVDVLANEDRTYVEYDFATPLAGTTVEKTYRGRKTDQGCEYSGSISASGSETRIWEEREVSNNTETCTMVMEGAWIPEVDSASSMSLTTYEHDGSIKGYLTMLGIIHNSTKSRIQWSDTSTCVTSASRTSIFSYSGWTRLSWITAGTATGCWRSRYTFAHYKNDSLCPLLITPPFAGAESQTSHGVTFYADPAGKSRASWVLKDWDDCDVFTAVGHTYDPN